MKFCKIIFTKKFRENDFTKFLINLSLQEIRITFRNTPTVTTLTSTTMVATQVTEFVTKTVRAQATLAPGAGLSGFGGGFNPLAALLG